MDIPDIREQSGQTLSNVVCCCNCGGTDTISGRQRWQPWWRTLQVMALTLTLALLAPPCAGYPHGPPHRVCGSMKPSHGSPPQTTSTSPYDLVIARDVLSYSPGEVVKVRIEGTPFVGFMLQVRPTLPPGSAPVGRFLAPPPYAKYLDCHHKGDTITHANNGPKWNMEFSWLPPAESHGPVHFIATLVFQRDTYWMNVTSRELVPSGYPDPPPEVHVSTSTLPASADVPYTTSALTAPPSGDGPDEGGEGESTYIVVAKTTTAPPTSLRNDRKSTTSGVLMMDEDHFPLLSSAPAGGAFSIDFSIILRSTLVACITLLLTTNQAS